MKKGTHTKNHGLPVITEIVPARESKPTYTGTNLQCSSKKKRRKAKAGRRQRKTS